MQHFTRLDDLFEAAQITGNFLPGFGTEKLGNGGTERAGRRIVVQLDPYFRTSAAGRIARFSFG
jgi:hypothetical protein